jgi:cellulose synthase/poly-beta-1,6-N-acetylglucosamine synthase-like glycosyltransferase
MSSGIQILGLSLHAFTQFHVALSLIGILSGLVVLLGMLGSKPLNAVTAAFLITTVLTSLTGFLFPYHGVTPGIVIGILSLIVLLLAILARYAFHYAGGWRATYVVTSVIALWFNVFVFIVQSFQKVPALHALAPTGTETPFKVSQLVVLITFIVLGVRAVRKFHPA